ncbi:hypothetical protein [Helicobacter trogontum]|uniref:Uncharacterized protein n=1 Tax=Helicobacter trogontum TaxID=50960 RepID=A0A099VE76_9HELI|nr:hypothetical protein [Helicobacter trogontum]TLD84700.1 hypothetical protein LS81_001455 [Helicobacter trogontum]
MFDFTLNYKEQQFFGFQRVCLFIGFVLVFFALIFWKAYNIPNIPSWLSSLGIVAGIMLLTKKGQFAKTAMLIGYVWLIACFTYSLLFFLSIIKVEGVELDVLLADIEAFLNLEGFITTDVAQELGGSVQDFIRKYFLFAHTSGLIYSLFVFILTFFRSMQKILPLLFVVFCLTLPFVCFIATFFV